MKKICIFLVLCCVILSACRLNGAFSSNVISAQYVSTHQDVPTATTLIDSKSELEAYYENYTNGSTERDDLDDFLKACEKYDDAFFAQNKLVLVSLMEGSGSISHEVTGITYSENSVNIKINRIHPEVGSCDVMGWHIFVELTDCKSLAENVDIDVTFEDIHTKPWFWQ